MLVDSRIKKWAKTLVDYSTEIKKGEKVFLRGSYETLPLLKEIYREVTKKEAMCEVKIVDNEFSEIFYKEANDTLLCNVSPIDEYIFKNFDVLISIGGEKNSKTLSHIDPKKIRKSMKARENLNKVFSKRVAEGKMRWVLTYYPTHSAAQEANMSLSEIEDFIVDACFLNSQDPSKEWKRIHKLQNRIIDFLSKRKNFRIVAKDTDLSFSTTGRKWINSDGHNNFPSGEVFTSPVETSINGKIRFTFPGIYMGREIEDIYLEFENGKIVNHKAKVGEELLKELLKLDEGASKVGEAAIGTNYGIKKFIKNMLFDEKIGGTVHLALGNGFKEAGSKNFSSLHWDILCDMRDFGEIYADGKLFYKNGKFLINGVNL
ncbi:MAG: Aminopeptidase [candidate division TA06 bacterium 32_111]|uniref:Aminopeptidase n=2 Tax=Bacteria candidate phyla TaxID=1783234 RepID=A0A117M629_UNCT6|nr:MAG: Aminopeptidase [candidate division TA06 bacterium 32_111]KUK86426.1 MAG: Aminopeptidase [candidate division TA06 bacterium 34_109]HAF06873.1 aminopeptidase [candidate division WOR-3 bacterium]HCP16103.1 aminopeptidase [candidate division WOR-3 bacterium]